jgi:hypothetical protein
MRLTDKWWSMDHILGTCALECIIRKVQENQVGLELNGNHELLVYTDDVDLLGKNRYHKETCRCTEVNTEKMKCVFSCCVTKMYDNHNIRICNTFENESNKVTFHS